MIKSTRQLKDKMNNITNGNSKMSQTLFRNYFMERFLERISLSKYNDNFVLKGGMLVASMLGLDSRATMDIDTSVFSIPLTVESAKNLIEEIAKIDIDDNVSFEVTDAEEIMEEHDYHGVRIKLIANFGTFKQPIKIDISTGDVITPSAVEYNYKLMLEDRSIPLLSYNLETLLAEKLETIIARSTANTRMRDYYDVYLLSKTQDIDMQNLKSALYETAKSRNTDLSEENVELVLNEISESKAMFVTWEKYKRDNYYVENFDWIDVVNESRELIETALEIEQDHGFEITM